MRSNDKKIKLIRLIAWGSSALLLTTFWFWLSPYLQEKLDKNKADFSDLANSPEGKMIKLIFTGLIHNLTSTTKIWTADDSSAQIHCASSLFLSEPTLTTAPSDSNDEYLWSTFWLNFCFYTKAMNPQPFALNHDKQPIIFQNPSITSEPSSINSETLCYNTMNTSFFINLAAQLRPAWLSICADGSNDATHNLHNEASEIYTTEVIRLCTGFGLIMFIMVTLTCTEKFIEATKQHLSPRDAISYTAIPTEGHNPTPSESTSSLHPPV